MINIVKFFIPGTPKSKQRHRCTRQGRMYTPSDTTKYEKLVRDVYQAKYGDFMFDAQPLSVEILALFKVPKSYTKCKKELALSGKIAPSTKDVDNIAKIVLDGLNGVAYLDDRHIVRLYVRKESTIDEEGVHVKIQET